MWYPGIADFAETSCIAAIESQACGTPFVGSYKGALPETVPSGILVKGDADTDPEYAEQAIAAVVNLLDGCKRQTFAYRALQQRGRAHVETAYTYDTLAAEWEAYIFGQFDKRKAEKGRQILDRLLHEDDHVAAQVMARELGDQAVADFCQHVIDGKEHTADDYATYALDPIAELSCNGRIPSVAGHLKDATHILDLACGNGSMAMALAQANPNAHVVGVDYAQGNIDVATRAAAQLGLGDRCTFVCAPVYDYTTHKPHAGLGALVTRYGPFDGVFIGEFLEHIANVTGFLNAVHQMVGPARVVCTVPSGPYCELNARDVPYKRGHVHHFRPRDLEALFSGQQNIVTEYLEAGLSARWSLLGTWVIAYDSSSTPIGDRPLAERIRTTRPMSKLSVGIIASEATDLRRCLGSIWSIADEIVIGNTGCKPDELAQVIAEFPKSRSIEIGDVSSLEGGFSEARNKVLRACTGEWFFWIDTDEVLVKAECLHRYLDATTFNGFAMRQNHLMLDSPKSFDTPMRVFRRMPTIQFYGCVHEQPQMGHCNGDILPSLQLVDAEIAHVLGYLTEDIRRRKCLQRNLPLLAQDQQVFPDRRLGKVLVIRDFLNLAQWEVEESGGRLTARAKSRLQAAIGMFEKHFSDPTDKYHVLARPFYEAALKHVAGSMEVEFSFAAQVNGLQGRPKPERVWVRNREQLEALLRTRVDTWTKPLHQDAIDCEPITQPTTEPMGVAH
jgi:2-polyprenyl-3-methyl-5-hydroxy-6-metoxy-1,4-benzoquinol methylase